MAASGQAPSAFPRCPTKASRLLLANLARTDALAKLFIKKGVITEAAFRAKLAQERARAKKAHRDSFRHESFAP